MPKGTPWTWNTYGGWYFGILGKGWSALTCLGKPSRHAWWLPTEPMLFNYRKMQSAQNSFWLVPTANTLCSLINTTIIYFSSILTRVLLPLTLQCVGIANLDSVSGWRKARECPIFICWEIWDRNILWNSLSHYYACPFISACCSGAKAIWAVVVFTAAQFKNRCENCL